MTPAAQYAAAIAILDLINDGIPAEKCLTTWARGNRFAGSKDRAAIRNHVYDVLRGKRSLAWLGGGVSGRALILGLLRRDEIDPDSVFGAGGYAPTALTDTEREKGAPDISMPQAVAADLPDWLWPIWESSLGSERALAAAEVQKHRAAVFLRANLQRATMDQVLAILSEDDIVAEVSTHVKFGLEVTHNERRIAQCRAYLEGYVELQDVASQIAMATLDLAHDARVLDYCAGGGGKALALADMHSAKVTAHDIAPQRLVDLPARAKRAGVVVKQATTTQLPTLPTFDVVLCDAPCSGSGTWRRTPEAKWKLTKEKLFEYNSIQLDVLAKAERFVVTGGALVYATCSVLTDENEAVVEAFLRAHPAWQHTSTLKLCPTLAHDGFFMVVLTRA